MSVWQLDTMLTTRLDISMHGICLKHLLRILHSQTNLKVYVQVKDFHYSERITKPLIKKTAHIEDDLSCRHEYIFVFQRFSTGGHCGVSSHQPTHEGPLNEPRLLKLIDCAN